MFLIKKIVSSALWLLVLTFCSCATYNSRIQNYYKEISLGNYDNANKELDKNKLLKASRNKLLYYLEKGRVAHALSLYDTSNYYFNEADRLMEQVGSRPLDVALGTLINPMMQQYKGEDFEKIMIHYYKALNYLYLNQKDEAIVEARRIDLQNRQQEDKFVNKEKRYSKDAFSLMLQGLIYEASDDVNNAFIAYRNASELYLQKENQEYYGVKLPLQLKKDLLRTALQNGFTDEVQRFEGIFKMKYVPENSTEGGSLVLFWENGMAPVKEQQDFFFSLTKGVNGFYFIDSQNNHEIPFDSSVRFNSEGTDMGSLNNIHVAFPRFVPRVSAYQAAHISINNNTIPVEQAEDITALAQAIQKQRFAQEMSKTLSRLAVKKAAQFLVKGKESNKKNKELREGLASVIDIYSLISEKADTRNWQTLPSTIFYSRIPLQKGKNEITITIKGNSGIEEKKQIVIEGKGKMQFYNHTSLK